MSSLRLSHMGNCPECGKTLAFNSSSEVIECPRCNQRHQPSSLKEMEQLNGNLSSFFSYYKLLKDQMSSSSHDPGPVKIQGVSSYECKLLSPLLTTYGMDKAGNPKLLTDLLASKSKVFEFSALAGRSFTVDKQHLGETGYGVDKASFAYLSELLQLVDDTNDRSKCLVPLHADGDGHCLVHAISRCLVGRELFWHALRVSLHRHLTENLARYREIFGAFVDGDRDEWGEIIDEARPSYRPPADARDGHGLRPIHIFGLANVLRRPIILIDGMQGMRSSCEYAGVYLPTLYSPEQCCGKSKPAAAAAAPPELTRPIAVAWGSSAHNHYVPLVATRAADGGGTLPPAVRLPADLVPKVAVTGQDDFRRYVHVERDGSVLLGGERCLSDSYIVRLTTAMRSLFMTKHQVASSLVADVYHYVFRASGAVHVDAMGVVDTVRQAAQEKRLHSCLSCRARMIEESDLSDIDMLPGGKLHSFAEQSGIEPRDGLVYNFPLLNLRARYEAADQRFVVEGKENMECSSCSLATFVRATEADGTVRYKDGDRTLTPTTGKSNCPCGYKHFYGGLEYNNIPIQFPIILDFNENRVPVTISWFENETDPELNSNAYKIASKLVNQHFPADFGSERLIQRVVQQIFKKVEANDKKTKVHEMEREAVAPVSDPLNESPMKTIMVGPSKTTLHKEELGVSRKEQQLRQRITDNAGTQRRKSAVKDAASEFPAKRSATAAVITASSDGFATTTAAMTSSPTTSAKPSPRRLKVRVCIMPGGRTADLEFNVPILPSDLQSAIQEKLSVPVERQRLRHGFPPRELKLTEGEEVKLQNGEKLSLEDIQPPSQLKQPSPISPFPSSMAAPSASSAASLWSSPSLASPSPSLGSSSSSLLSSQFATSGLPSSAAAPAMTRDAMRDLLKLLDYNPSADMFPEYRDRPWEFEGAGNVMQLAREVPTSGQLVDNEHVSLLDMPNKVFAYNKAADRLELCLGREHIAMSRVTPDHIRMAEQACARLAADAALGAASGGHSVPAPGSSSSSSSGRITAGGSGVVSSAHAAKSHHDAFTGHGHRMNAQAPATSASSLLGASRLAWSSASPSPTQQRVHPAAAAAATAHATRSLSSSASSSAAEATQGQSPAASSPLLSSAGAAMSSGHVGRPQPRATTTAPMTAPSSSPPLPSLSQPQPSPPAAAAPAQFQPRLATSATWSLDSVDADDEHDGADDDDDAGVSSPEDMPCSSDDEGSEGEAYKQEKPKKKRPLYKPSTSPTTASAALSAAAASLVADALDQRIAQLSEQTSILQAKLLQCSDRSSQDALNAGRKQQLLSQIASLQSELGELRTQRETQLLLAAGGAANRAVVGVDDSI